MAHHGKGARLWHTMATHQPFASNASHTCIVTCIVQEHVCRQHVAKHSRAGRADTAKQSVCAPDTSCAYDPRQAQPGRAAKQSVCAYR